VLGVRLANGAIETDNRVMPEKSTSDRQSNRPSFNRTTAQGEWQRRVARAEQLLTQQISASEILRFYLAVANFQREFSAELERPSYPIEVEAGINLFAASLPASLVSRFRDFTSLVARHGPAPLQRAAHELETDSKASHSTLLQNFWARGAEAEGLNDFFARAFLQPYAANLRSHSVMHRNGPAPYVCPLCNRKPGGGVLRPLGDGGQRSLVCSFCLKEWEFRRIVCPGCGEEDHAKLPVYTAEEFQHVRVEACDTCRLYIKTVDMTKNGLAEPVVDEIASPALDVWAQSQGYSKLQANLMQL
jgi:formate dehydrogenase accessory protein FdhE